MDLIPISKYPVGTNAVVLANFDRSMEDHLIGTEIHSGIPIAFPNVGEIEEGVMTLYNVRRTGAKFHGAWILSSIPGFPPQKHRPPVPTDLGFFHDVCCGLGGFATGLDFLHNACGVPGHVIAAVDVCPLATSAFQLNHEAFSIHGDICSHDTIFQMHIQQAKAGVQPLLVGGFPCQPLSRQGFQKRQFDDRSRVLPGLLKAAYWLQVSGVCLECVPEALSDASTQEILVEFAKLMNFTIYQRVLHLQHVWPAKRSRWFAVLLPNIPEFQLHPMPCLNPLPTVGDVIPFNLWPTWSDRDESQLEWTDLERQVYKDPTYGNPDRRVDLTQPLPTALHSWGSALYKCPCGCRSQGFSPSTLKAKGLRGIEVLSGLWPHASRHIHPRELQFLLGFPPLQEILSDCRAQLCLFGNSVSPIQVLWTLAHVYQGLNMMTKTPSECICEYMRAIIVHRDITWPSPRPGVGNATLDFPHGSVQVAFHTKQTIGDLIQAEATLQFDTRSIRLLCQDLELPTWAFVQERRYQVDILVSAVGFPVLPVPVCLEYLGIRKMYVVPSSFTIEMLLNWVGIQGFRAVVDVFQEPQQLKSIISPWQVLTVQSDPEDVEFELSLRLDGLGADNMPGTFGFRCTESWGGTGLWHVDQLVRFNLLVSWAGSGFLPLAVWLPSFASAVVELWPSSVEDSLKAWVSVPTTRLYAIVLEQWGWNLLRIVMSPHESVVTFFEPECQVSVSAAHLAFRAHVAGNRQVRTDVHLARGIEFGLPGTLERIFALLDFDLDLPSHVAKVLQQNRQSRPFDFGEDCRGTCSPTLVYEATQDQLPKPLTPEASPVAGIGLTAKFLFDFAKAWIVNRPLDFRAEQIKVVSVGQESALQVICQTQLLQVNCAPVFMFVLVDRHWTFLSCSLIQDRLEIMHYDGLACTSIQQLNPVIESLKTAWQVTRVSVHTTWKFPQTRIDSCGTIALAHFGFLLGLLTEDQADQFELLHESLAICGSMTHVHGPSGFGAEENAVIKSLEQILPAHGVPPDEVKNRALAAIKVFGIPAITRALGAKNTWMSLKQLGNSRPKPFMWITHEELQIHIRDRSHQQFGIESDSKKGRRSKEAKKPALPAQLDPASLMLPAGVFTTNDGTALAQIGITEAQKNARGIAFGTYQDVQPFLAEGKSISAEGLSILVVGSMPEAAPQGLPTHALRVPAIYRGTNEPIILDVISVQLGDQAVYRKISQEAPELAVFPTVVFRLRVFKDLWTLSHEWSEFVAHPVRSLVQSFPILKLCRNPDCDSLCGAYHPSIEETGVESGLVDVWAFRWMKTDGAKATPANAEVMSVYFRVPESSFVSLHSASGTDGVFFEPRCQDSPGADPAFSVVWIPQATMPDIMHKVKTHDHCLAACRIGTKYGVRCQAKYQEEVHNELRPQVPFVHCAIKEVYRLEPLPVGTHRQSLSDTLQTVNWKAKPLQPCKGSQGRAWTVGAETPPPSQFIQAKHGWISVAKVKDQVQSAPAQHLIATAKTKQHIGTTRPAASSAQPVDPWASGRDPWGGYQAVSVKAPAPPSQHVQQKFDDVEQRLQDHIKTTIAQELQDTDTSCRVQHVEQQIQSIIEHQTRLEHWVTEGGTKVTGLQQDCHQLHQAVEQCHHRIGEQGQAINQVATDVSACTQALVVQGQAITKVSSDVSSLQDGLSKTLESYFAKQTEQIESLMAKKARTA